MKYKHFCHVDPQGAQHHTCWTFCVYCVDTYVVV